uniref:ENTH domain-containing protein n=1 Tax=Solanum lycopersicum TaxID=4081 RepID=A0A3Q7J5X4_SOLLC
MNILIDHVVTISNLIFIQYFSQVVVKTLIVIHRVLRDGDPSFKEELLRCSQRGQIFQLSNFKDDSSHLGWDCSAWVRTYALFLEERLECFRTMKNDIVAERSTKPSVGISKVHFVSHLHIFM